MLASLVAYPATWIGWALVAQRRLDRVRRAKLQWRRVTRSSGDVLDGLRDQRAAVVTAVTEALGAPARSVTSTVVQGPWPTPAAQPAPP